MIGKMQIRSKIGTTLSDRWADFRRKRAHSKSKVRFSLGKYYADLVTADGQYFIGYSARLRLGRVKLSYAATLHHPAMTGISTGPVLTSHDMPIADDSGLAWSNPALGFDGRWRPLAPATKIVLHETSKGFVKWNCQQPAARVQLQTKSGKQYHGLGYAEFLNLTFPPWQLGLRILLWGRFISETDSVVWIEWQGEHPFTVLICNGHRMADAQIRENSVKCENFVLTFKHEATIRKGSLGETFISKIPSAIRVARIEFLGGREQKFLSRGNLKFEDGSQSTGWVIHERVSWPKNSN
jgi:hypothetical protein